jgi:hypothetical protein
MSKNWGADSFGDVGLQVHSFAEAGSMVLAKLSVSRKPPFVNLAPAGRPDGLKVYRGVRLLEPALCISAGDRGRWRFAGLRANRPQDGRTGGTKNEQRTTAGTA